MIKQRGPTREAILEQRRGGPSQGRGSGSHHMLTTQLHAVFYSICLYELYKIILILYVLFFFQPGLLGVFQKLIASKANDHQGFYLLNSIIEHLPP